MWATGLTMREIAAALDWSINHLGTEIAHLRHKGYALPYRHRPKHLTTSDPDRET